MLVDGSEIYILVEPLLPSSGILRTIMTITTETRWRNWYNDGDLVQRSHVTMYFP